MKVLLLGGTGFVGEYLVNDLKKKYEIYFTSNRSNRGIKFNGAEDKIESILEDNTSLIINNINPESLSFDVVCKLHKELGSLAEKEKIKLIQISSIFAYEKNRFISDYALKKSFSDDLIKMVIKSGNYLILRFPQLFDISNKAQKSQPGLYYLVKKVKQNEKINLFKNYKDCKRLYNPIEYLLKIINHSIEMNIKGLNYCYKTEFVLNPKELSTLFGDILKKDVYYSLGEKESFTYNIPPPEKWVSKILDDLPLFPFFERLLKV